jgi:acyl-CoA reductase-like NAD-dependent aldehyde dehydrogenase
LVQVSSTKIPIYRNFIAGSWTDSESSERLPNVNPAKSDTILGFMPCSTKSEALAAIEAARAAAEGWQATPAPKRAEALMRASRLFKERREDLARTATLEEGKAINEARQEADKAAQVFEYMAGAGRRLGGVTLPSAFPRNLAYTLRRPLGVVAIITPWNFPISIPAWKLAPALIAGNTVVFKPASLVPGSAEMIVQILDEAGFPDGVVNLIYGSGREIGDSIVGDPSVSGLSFTGSNTVGMHLHEQCALRAIPAQCEMGGKNPCIVLEDADMKLALTALIGGAFGATGQRCTAMSRAIVVESVADAFVERLIERTKQVAVGDGLEASTFMGPCVSEEQMNSVLEYVEIGEREGAKKVWGGKRLTDEAHARGFFVEPTIYDHVTGDMRIAREEIFGPILSIQRVADFDAAVEAANDVDFGLTSVIYTRDLVRALEFVDRIEAGMAHVNSPWLGGEVHMPFGGWKASGVGLREMGEEALNFYTQTKSVYIDYRVSEGS